MTEGFFTKKIFYRFFLPAMLSSVCLGLANLADALCVGIALGEPALAAVSLVSPIYMVFNVLDVGIAIGGAMTFARLMGEGRAKTAVNVFYQMLPAALIASAALAALGALFLNPVLAVLGVSPAHAAVYTLTRDYALRLLLAAPLFFLNQLFYHFIRCDDGEKRAGAGLVAGTLIDVGLSFVFVLGFDMGVKGAIWATILGTAAGVLIYLPHFFKKSNILSLRLKKPDRKLIASCCRTGFSSSSQYLAQLILFLALNNLLMRLHGESALAVFNVVLNVSYVLTGLYDGVGASMQPLAATFHGERNLGAQRQTLRLGLSWGFALGAAFAGLAALFAPRIAALFGLSEAMVDMGALALRRYCLGALLTGASMLLSSFWQAVGRERETFVLTALRTFAVYLLLAVPLAFGPLAFFWWVFPATEAVSLLLFFLWRSMRDRRLIRFNFNRLDAAPILQRMLGRDAEALGTLLAEVEAFCESQSAAPAQVYLATMAVEEMCQTIFLHTARTGKDDVYVQITLFPIAEGMFELHIRDNAPAFDPFSLRVSRIGEAENEDSAMDGMGVLLVKKKAKEFYYRHYQGFNTLTVRI